MAHGGFAMLDDIVAGLFAMHHTPHGDCHMTQWLPAALAALMFFGLWGFFSKLAIIYIDSKSALIYQSIGVFIIGIITLSLLDFKPAGDMKGLSFGILTGLAYGIGCLFYFIAADKGKLITLSPHRTISNYHDRAFIYCYARHAIQAVCWDCFLLKIYLL